MNAIHITQGLGKMTGIQSINTPTTGNTFCQAMQKTNTICKSCYAQRYEKMRPSLVNATTRNLFLAERYLELGEIPRFSEEIVRYHSYGELINQIHFTNFMYIAAANPHTIFTLWTKRYGIVHRALKGRGKPDNLILIYSSPIVGKVSALPKHFNKVFTTFARGSDMTDINCHGSCNTCRLCYSHNDTTHIHEIIK
jgi:hypothetical protein